MNGRERLRVSAALASATVVALDERDIRAAREEAFESGFMAGIGILLMLEVFIALLAAALWWFSK